MLLIMVTIMTLVVMVAMMLTMIGWSGDLLCERRRGICCWCVLHRRGPGLNHQQPIKTINIITYIALKIILWWHMNCLLSTHRSQLAVTEESRQSGWQAYSQFGQVLTSDLEQFWQVSIFIVNITSNRSFSAKSTDCIHKCSDYFIYFIKSLIMTNISMVMFLVKRQMLLPTLI